MTESYDAIVVGGGVVGAATAFNLKKLGCDRVMLMERDQTCSGGTAKSCAIVRTHYSIPTNTQLAVQSLAVFSNFKEALGHDEASGWTCREAEGGWRIDYAFVTPDLKDRLRAMTVDHKAQGSDHQPIRVEVDL